MPVGVPFLIGISKLLLSLMPATYKRAGGRYQLEHYWAPISSDGPFFENIKENLHFVNGQRDSWYTDQGKHEVGIGV